MKAPSKVLGIMLHGNSDYRREIRRGISSYMRSRPGWKEIVHTPDQPQVEWVQNSKLDGLIAQVAHEPLRDYLAQCQDLPAINVSGWFEHPGAPSVVADDQAIGSTAAQFLMDRGYTRFAVAGLPIAHFSSKREQAFIMNIKECGCEIHSFLEDMDVKHHPQRGWDSECLKDWLNQLPHPTALFVIDDALGRLAISACNELELNIPQDIAILGVNDDELICEMCNPTLSSINIGAYRIGYEATSRLFDMTTSSTLANPVVLIPPGKVNERESTQAFIYDDPVTEQALNHIHRQAHLIDSVETLLDIMQVSRRTLETKFQAKLGQSPWKVIQKVRIQHVQDMLIETDLPIAQVAKACGFANQYQLSNMFKRVTGESPTSYRKKHRSQ